MNVFDNATFAGNVGKDVVLRETPNGKKVTEVSFAVDRSYTDKDGKKVERTQWVRASLFDERAETLASLNIKAGDFFIGNGTVEVQAFLNKNSQPEASLSLKLESYRFRTKAVADSGSEGNDL